MKKAQMNFNIFTFIVVSFLAVVFFGGLIYTMGILNDVFHDVGLQNEVNANNNVTFPCIDNSSRTCGGSFYVNMTQAADQIWGSAYASIQALRMVAFVYILCLGASIILVGAFERKHPLLFFVYVLLYVLGLIFSPIISNSYESLLNSNVFGGELANFTTANFLLLNLPMLVLVIGALGSIFLFINLIRGGGEQL